MKILCTADEFEKAGNTDFLPLKCSKCGQSFLQRKSTIKRAMYYLAGLNKAKKTLEYCSSHCSGKGKRRKARLFTKKCRECKTFYQADRKDSKFCSKSCQSKFNYRKKPPRPSTRSRAERFLFDKVAEHLEPSGLEVKPNDRKFLETGLEIDIFVPDLDLAIEVNGPFHYKPIHGVERLKKVQKRDRLKAKELEEKGIRLLSIDISGGEHRAWESSKVILEQLFVEELRPLLQELQS